MLRQLVHGSGGLGKRRNNHVRKNAGTYRRPVERGCRQHHKDDLGADSLDLYELIMALEEEYDVEIPTDDLESINTVGDVINFLKEKGVE